VTLPEPDTATAPITVNTPLPPVTPLPLASQPGSGSLAPPPPAALASPSNQPSIPPPPANAYGAPAPNAAVQEALPMPIKSAAGPAISATWAAYSLFILSFTSLLLIVAMGIAAAVISHQAGVLGWIIALTIVINLVYAYVIFRMARPTGQPFRVPFQSPRRGP
jgi:hypothetical protein